MFSPLQFGMRHQRAPRETIEARYHALQQRYGASAVDHTSVHDAAARYSRDVRAIQRQLKPLDALLDDTYTATVDHYATSSEGPEAFMGVVGAAPLYRVWITSPQGDAWARQILVPGDPKRLAAQNIARQALSELYEVQKQRLLHSASALDVDGMRLARTNLNLDDRHPDTKRALKIEFKALENLLGQDYSFEVMPEAGREPSGGRCVATVSRKIDAKRSSEVGRVSFQLGDRSSRVIQPLLEAICADLSRAKTMTGTPA